MGQNDDRLAHELAAEAGRRLAALRGRGGDPDDLRAAGDKLSHEFLVAELAGRRPGDRVLSEEGADDPARLTADRVWIIDPLDGTREFGDPGRTDWAVHVALWERAGREAASPGAAGDGAAGDGVCAGGTLTAAAVALPAREMVLSTAVPPPAAPRSRPCGRPRIVVSRTRPPGFAAAMAARVGADLVPLGSAGAKVAAVLLGEADAYVHAGGQHEWDSAAPVAVARAAGFHASRIDGADLAYNKAEPLLPDMLVCLPALAGTLIAAISSVRAGDGS
ncbi:MAG TPA: inositol monophosphatase family protein [Streptosporangiaceae bacterium]|nr:inositol monophosphatase family protein [Streptosporangiaceae bacterium]